MKDWDEVLAYTTQARSDKVRRQLHRSFS